MDLFSFALTQPVVPSSWPGSPLMAISSSPWLPDFSTLFTWLAISMIFAAGLWRRRDLPALAARLSRLEELSARDLLTGLWSSRYLEQVALPAALRGQPRLALLWLDLDDFRRFNTAGHDGGDRALCRAARALESACRRGTDRLFRVYNAGDEFILLLPGADRAAAIATAQATQRALRSASMTASIGIFAPSPPVRLAQSEFLHRANTAERAAKKAGGHTIVCDDGERMHAIDLFGEETTP